MRFLKSRTVQVLFWIAVVALAANAARIYKPGLFAAAKPHRAKQVYNGKPFAYTEILQDYSVQPDGSLIPTQRITQAVRGDGSKAMEITNHLFGKTFDERILYLPSRQVYVMEHLQQKSSSSVDQSVHTPADWLPDPANNCLLGSTMQYAGVETIGAYRTAKLTSGPITVWRALDYGCAVIQDRADLKGSVSEKKLVALIPGEPSAALFDEPSFQEVSLSQMFPGPATK